MNYEKEVYPLILAFFNGDESKAKLWMTERNPFLGGGSADAMIKGGRGEKLLKLVRQQLVDNEPPVAEQGASE